jgi:FKBP-type peptidyl-prolyl cis-trans isomerase
MEKASRMYAGYLYLPLLMLIATGAQASGQPPNSKQKGSYTIGYMLGAQLREVSLKLDNKWLMQGFDEGYRGQQTQESFGMAVKSIDDVLTLTGAPEGQPKSFEAKNYIESLKKDPSWKKSKSGHYFLVKSKGEGSLPRSDEKLLVHYRIALSSGQVIDSSYEKGVPIQVNMSGVLESWREALVQMPPGAVWRIAVPPELNSKSMGIWPIAKDSVFIYDLERVVVK